MFLAILVVMLSVLALPTGKFVLVIMPPGARPAALIDAIAQSGGTFVDSTRFGWMGVAYSDRADFSTRLRSAGALLVVNHLLVAGCKGRISS